jgi:ABC-type sulfate/molybdate transport systems ATPase subunit
VTAISATLAARLGDFDLAVELEQQGGVLVLFGPSGAGKTLTLQLIAGLIRPASGRVVVDGDVLYDHARRIDVPAHRRRIGWVPQHHTLFEFTDVAGNVAFGLPRAERSGAVVRRLLEDVGLAGMERARPASLSGGERQRVALARALATRPRLLLLDEPFASLDAASRAALREALRRAIGSTPAIFVTHDRDEALAIGDQIVRYERGRTVESGTPASILGAAVTVRGVVRGDRLEDARVEGAPDGPIVVAGRAAASRE